MDLDKIHSMKYLALRKFAKQKGVKSNQTKQRIIQDLLEQESSKEKTRQEVLEKVEDTVQTQFMCPTCLELFINPVMLNCGHTFCWLCLNQWKSAKGSASCPQCRTDIQHETKALIIGNMIDASMANLGEDRIADRRDKVAERKSEEAKFLKKKEAWLQKEVAHQRAQMALNPGARRLSSSALGVPARPPPIVPARPGSSNALNQAQGAERLSSSAQGVPARSAWRAPMAFNQGASTQNVPPNPGWRAPMALNQGAVRPPSSVQRAPMPLNQAQGTARPSSSVQRVPARPAQRAPMTLNQGAERPTSSAQRVPARPPTSVQRALIALNQGAAARPPNSVQRVPARPPTSAQRAPMPLNQGTVRPSSSARRLPAKPPSSTQRAPMPLNQGAARPQTSSQGVPSRPASSAQRLPLNQGKLIPQTRGQRLVLLGQKKFKQLAQKARQP